MTEESTSVLLFTGLAPVVLCASALVASFDSLTLAQGRPFDSLTLAQGRQAPGVPAFEVASIKPNVSGAEATASYVQPGGRYTAINTADVDENRLRGTRHADC